MIPTTPADIARALIDLALALAPVEELQEYLTDTARARADAIADEAERVKVGS